MHETKIYSLKIQMQANVCKTIALYIFYSSLKIIRKEIRLDMTTNLQNTGLYSGKNQMKISIQTKAAAV
jgi:hypothetical protein